MTSCRTLKDINRYLQQCIKLSYTDHSIHIADLDYISYTYCSRRNDDYTNEFKLKVLTFCDFQEAHINHICDRWEFPEDLVRANCKSIK